MGFICKCSMRLSCFVVFCCDIYIDSGRLKPKILPVGLILFLCERFFYTNDHIPSGTDEFCRGSYRLIDENTGEIRRQVSVSNNTMLPKVFIGGSCYGYMAGPKGWHLGYISEEDFWNGDFSKAIPFNAIE